VWVEQGWLLGLISLGLFARLVVVVAISHNSIWLGFCASRPYSLIFILRLSWLRDQSTPRFR
jgi:hypothetical protein